MNIKAASKQIEEAVRAYLSVDELGSYRIPLEMQRPIIMLGPPGVGKTAIVSQIAEKLGINFVSYSITHHTRQSALGLPFISTREYDGQMVSISEYTMSEIIAATYDAIDSSGVKEGIIFLDEVNCVSETLAPAMLQFLQYKTFGRHRLPNGWIIVTAGNPPEYNKAARDFDPATLDRMKRINVEPDLDAWQEYAASHGVHPAITTYLECRPADFYIVRSASDGMRLVTARGWEDLSRIIKAYEAEHIYVDDDLIGQYLQDERVSRDFAAYFSLFMKYKDDYKVTEILDGGAQDSIVSRASQAPLDERVAIIGLLLDCLVDRVHDAVYAQDALVIVRSDLLSIKQRIQEGQDPSKTVFEKIEQAKDPGAISALAQKPAHNNKAIKARRIALLGMLVNEASLAKVRQGDGDGAFEALRSRFNAECDKQADKAGIAVRSIDNALSFLDDSFGEGDECMLFLSRACSDPAFIDFVGSHRSEQFMRHNKKLIICDQEQSLLEKMRLAADSGQL